MKANPGGQLAPSQVIGRDELIARLWRILERQGLVMSAERRIGKTSLMKKMVDQARDDKEKLSIYHDLEGVRTRLEFVEILMTDVEEHLGRVQRTAQLTGAAQDFQFAIDGTAHGDELLPERGIEFIARP